MKNHPCSPPSVSTQATKMVTDLKIHFQKILHVKECIEGQAFKSETHVPYNMSFIYIISSQIGNEWHLVQPSLKETAHPDFAV